jgi:hypothetical protein
VSPEPNGNPWSLDARIMVRPAREYQLLRDSPSAPGLRAGIRRPLFLALAMGAIVSLITVNGLTMRLAGSGAIAWSFVPLVEGLALAAVLFRRRKGTPFPVLLDRFFAGHAPWTLLMIAIAAMMAFVPPKYVWDLLTGPYLLAAALVVLWSAYVDYCFFRYLVAARRAAAMRDVAVLRLLTWPIVFWIFAVPGGTPADMSQEVAEAIRELIH